ncbi:MAG: methylated-DNA--[protein]-cysteine S-methyltransferase, partial [Burkholderiaceae bacterium]|nr:methylated-DNA--[protein]-cysteine S-methyltransferase [Burkholderiaceae bacterium]
FSSSSRFYEGANAMLGMKPKQVQRKGEGTIIHYAVHECALGQVIIAATERGICAIEFGDKADELIASLRERFSHATLMLAEDQMQAYAEQILQSISQPDSLAALPLDLQGTMFQQRVWQALRTIPPGQTLSYTALAEKIGQPNAARAVASACAANQIALAIPCHRIVRSDGSLSGYRWGVARKAALLKLEKEL